MIKAMDIAGIKV